MGWTTSYYAKHYKPNGSVDRRAECDDLFTGWVNDGHRIDFKIHKSAMVGSVYYAAVERFVDGASKGIHAAVFLTCGKSSDGTIWGYKAMDEAMGPFSCDCPASILDLLTPPVNECARKWRENCRARLAEKAAKAKAKAEQAKAEGKVRTPYTKVIMPQGLTMTYHGGRWPHYKIERALPQGIYYGWISHCVEVKGRTKMECAIEFFTTADGYIYKAEFERLNGVQVLTARNGGAAA